MNQIYTHEIIATTPHLPVYCSIYNANKQLVPGHWHDHIEILFPLEGTLFITIHDQEYAIKQHDVFIVNTNNIHSTKSYGVIKIFMLQIPYDYLDLFIYNFPYLQFQEYFDQITLQNTSAFLQLQKELLDMASIFLMKTDGYEFEYMSHLHHFFHILYLNFSTRLQQLSQEPKHVIHLKKSLQYIREHYMEPLALKQIADIAALNQEYFCRIFKKYTGNTFLEYVNLIRLTYIYEDVLNTDDSITDIIERHGFTNYKVFSRMFRENYGNTPAVLRRQHKVLYASQ